MIFFYDEDRVNKNDKRGVVLENCKKFTIVIPLMQTVGYSCVLFNTITEISQ